MAAATLGLRYMVIMRPRGTAVLVRVIGGGWRLLERR